MADSWEDQAEEQITYQPPAAPKLNPMASTFTFSPGASSFTPGPPAPAPPAPKASEPAPAPAAAPKPAPPAEQVPAESTSAPSAPEPAPEPATPAQEPKQEAPPAKGARVGGMCAAGDPRAGVPAPAALPLHWLERVRLAAGMPAAAAGGPRARGEGGRALVPSSRLLRTARPAGNSSPAICACCSLPCLHHPHLHHSHPTPRSLSPRHAQRRSPLRPSRWRWCPRR